jgi:hypothetical protein
MMNGFTIYLAKQKIIKLINKQRLCNLSTDILWDIYHEARWLSTTNYYKLANKVMSILQERKLNDSNTNN